MHLPGDVRPAIVGRDREQAELAAALARAAAGHGGAVLVLVRPVWGKSMLADWLVSQAEQAGVRIARSACSAAGMPPLWPWRRSLTAIGLELPWREDPATAGPAGREVLAAAIVEAIAAAAARQPLLTCGEEHDEATQQVRDRLAGLPASVRRVLLPPLDEAAVAALMSSVAGPGLAGQDAAALRVYHPRNALSEPADEGQGRVSDLLPPGYAASSRSKNER